MDRIIFAFETACTGVLAIPWIMILVDSILLLFGKGQWTKFGSQFFLDRILTKGGGSVHSISMLLAVQLNYDSGIKGCEVDDEASQRHLTSETDTGHLTIANLFPEFLLPGGCF